MDITRKKVLFISLDNVLADDKGITDFHVRRDILDRIRSLNISRVVIIYPHSEDKDFFAKVKAIEFFVFAYCKTAVSTICQKEDMVEDITDTLSSGLKKKELFVSIGCEVDGIDHIKMEDFLCMQ